MYELNIYILYIFNFLSFLHVEPEEDDIIDKLRESLIHEELLNMQALLKSRISQERNEIKRLMEMLMEHGSEKKKPKERIHSPNEAEMTAMIQLVKENQLLEVHFLFLFILHQSPYCMYLYILFVTEKDDNFDTQYYRGKRCMCRTACSISCTSINGQDLTADLLVIHRNCDKDEHLYTSQRCNLILFLHIMSARAYIVYNVLQLLHTINLSYTPVK